MAAFLLFVSAFAVPVQPAAADSTDVGAYMVRLERGDSLQVVRLEPATFGMFRYVRTDSVEGYLGWHKVRALMDAQGDDVTRDVRDRRRAIGVDPLAYRRPGSSKVWPRHPSHREEGTFPMFEVGIYSRVHGGSPTSQTMAGVDAGAMRNLSRSVGVGGTLHFELESGREALGLALRGRRWLSNSLSLDGTAGWIFAGNDDRGAFKPRAFSGGAALNWGDDIQLAVQVESWKWAPHDRRLLPVASGTPTPPIPDGFEVVERELAPSRETLVHFGAKVGRYPGMIAFIAVVFSIGALTSVTHY